MQENQNKTKNTKKRVILFIALFFFICSAVYLGYYFYDQYAARQEDAALSALTSNSEKSTDPKFADNPIDFKPLIEKNSDIYSWIKVPGTKIDYPVVQSATDDDFYLRHSALDKSWISSGAVFSQRHNTKTFDDYVTVLYGHNGYSESMFTTLHKFADKTFFDEHDTFYVYLPERKLTYQIISAFKYDDRHILNAFDFQNTAELEDFQKMLKDPVSVTKNVRTNPDIKLDNNSKIVILSTCITNQKSSRYLVCGVMIKDEQTH